MARASSCCTISSTQRQRRFPSYSLSSRRAGTRWCYGSQGQTLDEYDELVKKEHKLPTVSERPTSSVVNTQSVKYRNNCRARAEQPKMAASAETMAVSGAQPMVPTGS